MMFPMISNVDEVRLANQLVQESKEELREEGLEYHDNLEVGIMVEVPSAALLSREMATLVDFFSIGTNDLVQYTLAVDRGNQRISHLYQSFNPAVLQLIHKTIVSAHQEGIWCGLCGEIAADPRATILLVGLGIDELSVNPPSVPKIKGIIHSISRKDARKIADDCLRLSSHDEVVAYLDQKASEFLPDEFFEGYSKIL
jgi:phosphotransferase system enzyme I (PtsI)